MLVLGGLRALRRRSGGWLRTAGTVAGLAPGSAGAALARSGGSWAATSPHGCWRSPWSAASELGLAAVQLLPLYQLGERSMRAAGELRVLHQLLGAADPAAPAGAALHLSAGTTASDWGLWSAAETTIYVGVAPLLLALVALAYLRTRPVAFFGALLGLSLLLALGDYLPVKLY